MSGFTIVELLIVIVVIAILATIGIVAYSGAQQRARTSVQLAAAKSYLDGINAYIAANGKHPDFSIGRICIMMTQSECVNNTSWNRDGTFENSLKTIMSTLPTPSSALPISSTPKIGYVPISSTPSSNVTLDGVDTAFLIYAIEAPATCTVGTPVSGTWPNYSSTPPSQGYTSASSTVRACFIPIPPAS